MKWILGALVVCTLGFSAVRAEDGATVWSAVQGGLRGRLVIEPVLPADSRGQPTFKVVLQLQNLGVEGNWGNIPANVRFAYSEEGLDLQVANDKGAVLQKFRRIGDFDFITGGSEIGMPPDSLLSFCIGNGGESPPTDQGPGMPPGKLLTCGLLRNEWIIPPPSAARYYLFGTLTVLQVSRRNGASLAEIRAAPNHGWYGKLELPKVEIPRS